METILLVLNTVFSVVAMIIVIALISALPVMLLVNFIFAPEALTAVFGDTSIGFLKALFLNLWTGLTAVLILITCKSIDAIT